MYSCSECGSRVSKPFFVNGMIYGSTCVKKFWASSGKKAPKKPKAPKGTKWVKAMSHNIDLDDLGAPQAGAAVYKSGGVQWVAKIHYYPTNDQLIPHGLFGQQVGRLSNGGGLSHALLPNGDVWLLVASKPSLDRVKNPDRVISLDDYPLKKGL